MNVVLFFLVLIFINQVLAGCEHTYATICETLYDFKRVNNPTISDVIIKSTFEENPPKKPLHLDYFSKKTSVTIVGQISALYPEGDCFKTYSRLKFVNLYDNDFKNLQINAIPRKSRIIKLSLKKNQIETIEPGTFSECQPKIIDLSYNKIEVLETYTFMNPSFVNVTEEIILRFNKLATIEPHTFPSTLRILDLHNNSLSFLEPGVFEGVSNLGILVLSENTFSIVPNITSLTKLFRLDLSHNRITRLHGKVFSKNVYIDSLDLSQNKIFQIDKDAFFGLASIRNLNLNYNRIQFLNFLSPIINNWVQVSLAFNLLQTIDFEVEDYVTMNTVTLILYGNPWKCSRWISIEEDLNRRKVKREYCDEMLFKSGQVPFCVCYQHNVCNLNPKNNIDSHYVHPIPYEPILIHIFQSVAKNNSYVKRCITLTSSQLTIDPEQIICA